MKGNRVIAWVVVCCLISQWVGAIGSPGTRTTVDIGEDRERETQRALSLGQRGSLGHSYNVSLAQETSFGLQGEGERAGQAQEQPNRPMEEDPRVSLVAHEGAFLGEEEVHRAKVSILRVEQSWRHYGRWVYWSHMVNRGLYWIFLKDSTGHDSVGSSIAQDSGGHLVNTSIQSRDVHMLLEPLLEDPEENERSLSFLPGHLLQSMKGLFPKAWGRLWISGMSFPFDEDVVLKRIHGVNAFVAGIEEVLMEGLHLFLLVLLVSQLVYSAQEGEPFSKVLDIFFVSGDDNSIRDFYSITSPVPHAGALWTILLLPVVWGLYGGIQGYRTGVDREHNKHALDVLRKGPSSVFRDYFRWSLPFYDQEHALHILSRSLLWDQRVSLEEKTDYLEAIKKYCQKHPGRGLMNGTHVFYQVVAGISVKDMEHLSQEEIEGLLDLKAKALIYLQETGLRPREKLLSREIFSQGVPALYARYLLWTLGHYPKVSETIGWGIFRAAKTALSLILFKTLIEGILDILNCPRQPGTTWTGKTSWAADFTYECWQAYMKAFNQVPGQPAETLIALFPQFHLPEVVTFDVSGKGINGSAMAQLLRGFRLAQPGVSIGVFNGSGNMMGFISPQDTVDFCAELRYLEALVVLDLSRNWIGNFGSRGIQSLGEGLRYLPNLQTLNLENNTQISASGSMGTVALGESMRHVPQLKNLNLAMIGVGYSDSKGIVALAEGLSSVPNLQTLDLSGNFIGSLDSNGTVALAEGLSSVPNLQTLDLSANWIGYTDSNGTVALGIGLRSVRELQTLDLSTNFIGKTGSDGIASLGENLHLISKARWLGLDTNTLYNASQSSLENLQKGIESLSSLTTLNIDQQAQLTGAGVAPLPVTFQVPQTIPLWMAQNLSVFIYSHEGLGPITTDLHLVQTPEELETYLNKIPNTTLELNLNSVFRSSFGFMETLSHSLPRFSNLTTLRLVNNYIGNSGSEEVIAFAGSLPFLRELRTLDLSNNMIGYRDSQGVIALAEGLRYVPHLLILDVSGNVIGYKDTHGEIALGEALRFVPQLKSLDLSNNLIGYRGTQGMVALAEGFRNVPRVQTLDLSNNLIGLSGSSGVVALGEGLRNVPELHTLDLSGVMIGLSDSSGTVALGEGLRYVPGLRTLVLSQNAIGSMDSRGMVSLGKGLEYVRGLQILDLSGNQIGSIDSIGTVALGEAMKDVPGLQILDLSENAIGLKDSKGTKALGNGLKHVLDLKELDISNTMIGFSGSNGTVALGEGLQQLGRLEFLNLADDYIGYHGPEGSQAILEVLPVLFASSLEEANIQGMTNITWKEAQNAFSIRLDRQLEASCATQRCHGGAISQPSFHESSDRSRLRRMIANLEGSPVEIPSNRKNGTIIPDEIFFSDFKTSFVTSGASRLEPPRVLSIIPEMLGGLYYGVRHVLTPVSEPIVSMGGSHADYLEVKAIPSVRTEYSDASDTLSPKTKSDPFRPPEGPGFRLDEVMTGAVAWYLVGKAAYEWWYHLRVPGPSIDYAPRHGRGKWERHTNHLFKKARKALEVLGRFSKDAGEVDEYKDALEWREEEFEELRVLSLQKHPSQESKSLAPLKKREDLEEDMHFFLRQLESELMLNNVQFLNGVWVKG